MLECSILLCVVGLGIIIKDEIAFEHVRMFPADSARLGEFLVSIGVMLLVACGLVRGFGILLTAVW